MITGYSNDYDRISKLYSNDGSGVFTEVTDTPFEGVNDSSIAFADIDADQDQDLLITGYNIGLGAVSLLYRNQYDLLDIIENQAINTVQIYLNPSLHIFTVNTDYSVQDVKIYNLQGQEMPFIFDNNLCQLQVNYPKGIYSVKLKIDRKDNTLKMIVK